MYDMIKDAVYTVMMDRMNDEPELYQALIELAELWTIIDEEAFDELLSSFSSEVRTTWEEVMILMGH